MAFGRHETLKPSRSVPSGCCCETDSSTQRSSPQSPCALNRSDLSRGCSTSVPPVKSPQPIERARGHTAGSRRTAPLLKGEQQAETTSHRSGLRYPFWSRQPSSNAPRYAFTAIRLACPARVQRDGVSMRNLGMSTAGCLALCVRCPVRSRHRIEYGFTRCSLRPPGRREVPRGALQVVG
jgi:hypothetical protein